MSSVERDEPLFTNLILQGAHSVASGISSAILSVAQEAATVQADKATIDEIKSSGIAPWQTLGEQFSILEPTLKERCLQIPLRLENFSRQLALRRDPSVSILPGCLPMAYTALEADATLRELRFRLVPSQLSEDEFWKCYFWQVALIKCELCHDWSGANFIRRHAKGVNDAVEADDEALFSAQDETDSSTATAPRHEELDAEFDRLVGSPS